MNTPIWPRVGGRTCRSIVAERDLLAAPLGGHWLTGLGVVDQGSDVELQELCVLLNDVLRSTVLLLFPQPVVGLDDVRQLVRQIVFRPAGRGKRVNTVTLHLRALSQLILIEESHTSQDPSLDSCTQCESFGSLRPFGTYSYDYHRQSSNPSNEQDTVEARPPGTPPSAGSPANIQGKTKTPQVDTWQSCPS